MPDRKKVIKGLECCSSSEWRCPLECPYYGQNHETACRKLLEKDALELLKEQKHKLPMAYHWGRLPSGTNIKVVKYDE